jgi:hypothetical protein
MAFACLPDVHRDAQWIPARGWPERLQCIFEDTIGGNPRARGWLSSSTFQTPPCANKANFLAIANGGKMTPPSRQDA